MAKNRAVQREEADAMSSEKGIKLTQIATIYELRMILTSGEKKQYTLEELVELLDKIAMAKNQE